MQFPGFETWLKSAFQPQDGYFKDRMISLGEWFLNTGATLPASGNVSRQASATNLFALVWGPSSAASDTAVWSGAVPFDFKPSVSTTGDRSAIILRVKARVVDSGANPANTDLAIRLTGHIHNSTFSAAGVESDGDTSLVALTAQDATLTADVAATSEEASRWYSLSITSALTAAQLAALTPGATLVLRLGPNKAPGTGLSIEVQETVLIYRGHASTPFRWLRDLITF